MAVIELLKKRAKIVQAVRNFFIDNYYLEVETPVMSPYLIPESSIEVFETTLVSPYGDIEPQSFYLTPSPEIWMKKLLSIGSGSIFQITKSFRNSEQTGKYHNPEFTMLEWYTVDADYLDSIDFTEKLFKKLSQDFNADFISPPFIRLSVQQAFEKYASINLEQSATVEIFSANAADAGFSVKKDYNWEEIFNSIFLTAVEPELPAEKPVILYDYPQQIPCLARKKAFSPWLERWELYIKGIETANCFTEETDKKNIESFFVSQAELKKKSIIRHKVDYNYTSIFNSGFPACSGTALGIDRLVMALTGAENISEIIPGC